MVFNYTDLTLALTVDAGFLSELEDVYITIETAAVALTIQVDPDDIDVQTGEIKIELTQEQTGKLLGKALVQVNGFLNGSRWASEQGVIMFKRNLLSKVVSP